MATGRRRGRAIIYIALILILLVVLLAVLLRFNPFASNGGPVAATDNNVAQPTPTQVQDVVNIVVTTQDVTRGQELNDDLLALVAIPRADYTDGVFYKTKEELVSARAKYDLKAHTPLTNALLVTTASTGSTPAFEIPAGKVAISVPVSQLSSVSYGLQKGDHVNVLVSLLLLDLDTNWQTKLPNRTGMVVAPGTVGKDATQTNVTASLSSGADYTNNGTGFSYLGRIEIDPTLNNPVYVVQSESQRPRMVSQTLIQDAIVLQVGNFEQDTAAPQNTETNVAGATTETTEVQQGEPQPTPAPTIPDVATLIVEPQDAVTINYLMLAGANLNLVMRSAGDTTAKNTEAVTLQFIMDQYRIPNPAKLPYGLEPRMDNFPEKVLTFPEGNNQTEPAATGQ